MARPSEPNHPQPHTAHPGADALRALLDRFLSCPVDQLRAEIDAGLRAYQTGWIQARAGVDAAAPMPSAAPADSAAGRVAPAKPKFPIPAADLEVLARMADGWTPTTAEVGRWVWLENRELVLLEPNPDGGPEIMRLAAAGWAAIGRTPA